MFGAVLVGGAVVGAGFGAGTASADINCNGGGGQMTCHQTDPARCEAIIDFVRQEGKLIEVYDACTWRQRE
ncbi:hypothetical protein ACFVMC_17720 [Nocardia sp. NPDC127579]|uniref:hypothetical protein n=1 Tax=Nocardia sp. NPDC127579 TaxID=3345402 RepID=UPI00363DB952